MNTAVHLLAFALALSTACASSAATPIVDSGESTSADAARTDSIAVIDSPSDSLRGDDTIADATSEAAAAVATPVFTPPGGTYGMGSVTITMSSVTPGATIYFTTDGSAPTMSSSRYTAPLTLTRRTIVQAFAAKDGQPPSPIVVAEYVVTIAG